MRLLMLWLQKLRYHLNDCALWEFMFPSNDKPPLVLSNDGENADFEVSLFFLILLKLVRNPPAFIY